MADLTTHKRSRSAVARFRQADLERVFRAAKKVEVRALTILKPNGEIEIQMLTDCQEVAQGPSALRRKVFGGAKD